MSCQEFDWKEYVLDEAAPDERRRMTEHLAACAACGEEVEQLRLTLTALRRVPDVEIPRRISFVSDPVFEPSWWQRFWTSAPRLGFASAAMLALAILAHGFLSRPVSIQTMQAAQLEERVQAEVARRLPAAVDERVEARLQPAMAELGAQLGARIDGYEKAAAVRRNTDMKDVETAMSYLQRKMNNMVLTAARYGGD